MLRTDAIRISNFQIRHDGLHQWEVGAFGNCSSRAYKNDSLKHNDIEIRPSLHEIDNLLLDNYNKTYVSLAVLGIISSPCSQARLASHWLRGRRGPVRRDWLGGDGQGHFGNCERWGLRGTVPHWWARSTGCWELIANLSYHAFLCIPPSPFLLNETFFHLKQDISFPQVEIILLAWGSFQSVLHWSAEMEISEKREEKNKLFYIWSGQFSVLFSFWLLIHLSQHSKTVHQFCLLKFGNQFGLTCKCW